MRRCAPLLLLAGPCAGQNGYGTCYLKYSADGATAKDGVTMCTMKGGGGCTFTPNMDVQNSAGGASAAADGVEQCCAACAADSQCKAAVHVKNSMAGTTCSSNILKISNPQTDTSQCEGFSSCGRNCGNSYSYPKDFPIKNSHQWYTCPKSGQRIVVSNGVPDHDLKVYNPNDPCTAPWFVSVPLNGTYTDTVTELPPLGFIGMQLNGVPMYGAQEDPFDGDSNNAVQPPDNAQVVDGGHWFGHTSPQKQWHYHAPWMGHSEYPASTVLLGYALDGFPVYGPVDDTSVLDGCNGRTVGGKYQYHTRRVEQVNATVNGKVVKTYCNGFSPECNWPYILGCYHGDVSKAQSLDSRTASLPSDCVKDAETHSLRIGHVSHLSGRVLLRRK